MADDELQLTVKPDFQGIGDAEEYTISEDAAKDVAGIVKQDLYERYETIPLDAQIDVLAVKAPNRVDVHIATDE